MCGTATTMWQYPLLSLGKAELQAAESPAGQKVSLWEQGRDAYVYTNSGGIGSVKPIQAHSEAAAVTTHRRCASSTYPAWMC